MQHDAIEIALDGGEENIVQSGNAHWRWGTCGIRSAAQCTVLPAVSANPKRVKKVRTGFHIYPGMEEVVIWMNTGRVNATETSEDSKGRIAGRHACRHYGNSNVCARQKGNTCVEHAQGGRNGTGLQIALFRRQ